MKICGRLGSFDHLLIVWKSLLLNLALPINPLMILSFQPAVLIPLHLHLLPG